MFHEKFHFAQQLDLNIKFLQKGKFLVTEMAVKRNLKKFGAVKGLVSEKTTGLPDVVLKPYQ